MASIMTRANVSVIGAAILGASLLMTAQRATAQKNAPPEARKEVADLIREALIPGAEKLKFEDTAEERHREVIPVRIGPVKEDIVTYWRSTVSGSCVLVDPKGQLTIDVPKMVLGNGKDKDKFTITVTASAPAKGNVSGTARTDDNRVTLVTINSPYTCTLSLTAECTVTQVIQKGQVAYKVDLAKCDPKISGLTFGNALDRLKGEGEKIANKKLGAAAGKLCETANKALQKAFEEGKLKFPQ